MAGNRRRQVMEMQHGLLSDKLDDRDTNPSAVELIKSMADGTSAYRAGALKFGLRELFNRKKRR